MAGQVYREDLVRSRQVGGYAAPRGDVVAETVKQEDRLPYALADEIEGGIGVVHLLVHTSQRSEASNGPFACQMLDRSDVAAAVLVAHLGIDTIGAAAQSLLGCLGDYSVRTSRRGSFPNFFAAATENRHVTSSDIRRRNFLH